MSIEQTIGMANAATRTLTRMGYTYNGGHEWKPPIGKAPNFDLMDELRKGLNHYRAHATALEVKLRAAENAMAAADEAMEGVTDSAVTANETRAMLQGARNLIAAAFAIPVQCALDERKATALEHYTAVAEQAEREAKGLKPFDAADHLKTPEECAAYLEEFAGDSADLIRKGVWDVVRAVQRMVLGGLAAPALEAPAAPSVPLKASPEMRAAFRSAFRQGGFWDDRLDYALGQMLAAAPQAPRLGEDALHLLRRLLSNQHTLTGPEFRSELEKIVAEESARHAAAPQAPAAPVAYLDLGAGGYMDLGTDLSEQQLGALPKGRHMLAIIGTYGIDGYAAAPAAPAVDAPALGEWVATLEVDSEGGLDYETVPPCTLPPGCYRLYRAAQAKEGGA